MAMSAEEPAPAATPEAAHVVPISALRTTALALLRQVRVPLEHAEQIAEVLIDTELRGYSDHGILSLSRLIDRCRTGAVNPTPRPRIVREAPAAMLLDADQGCGIIASRQAMEWCIAAARTQGLASAGVTNSSHFIGCAFYVELAARAGMIGFACGSAGQAMPPPGGLTATLGTNPLGYAYPARRHDPVILDMATTASAGAKISLAAQLGHPIEPGLLTDAAGNPTTDPACPERRRADAADGRLQGVRLGNGCRQPGRGVDGRRVRAHRRHHARPGRTLLLGAQYRSLHAAAPIPVPR